MQSEHRGKALLIARELLALLRPGGNLFHRRSLKSSLQSSSRLQEKQWGATIITPFSVSAETLTITHWRKRIVRSASSCIQIRTVRLKQTKLSRKWMLPCPVFQTQQSVDSTIKSEVPQLSRNERVKEVVVGHQEVILSIEVTLRTSRTKTLSRLKTSLTSCSLAMHRRRAEPSSIIEEVIASSDASSSTKTMTWEQCSDSFCQCCSSCLWHFSRASSQEVSLRMERVTSTHFRERTNLTTSWRLTDSSRSTMWVIVRCETSATMKNWRYSWTSVLRRTPYGL